MNSKKIIFIGCGTGRCGTVSFSKLVENCMNITSTHEKHNHLPWKYDDNFFMEKYLYFLNHPQSVGDTALYYLPYLTKFIKKIPNIKIVCLKRNKKDTIKSMEKHIGNQKNHWLEHNNINWNKDIFWDQCFPKYEIQNRKKAISLYWDEYYFTINKLKNKFPKNIILISINYLNNKKGQEKIFNFLKIPKTDRRFMDKCKFN